MAIRIMITDDHSMIREGLKNLLELEGDIEVVAEAENGIECLDKLDDVNPDVLLLDINMPKMNGLEVLQNLKERKSKVKGVMLEIIEEYMSEDVLGYIPSETEVNDFIWFNLSDIMHLYEEDDDENDDDDEEYEEDEE